MTDTITVVSVAPTPITVVALAPVALAVVPVGYGLQGIPGPKGDDGQAVDLVADPLAYYILAKT